MKVICQHCVLPKTRQHLAFASSMSYAVQMPDSQPTPVPSFAQSLVCFSSVVAVIAFGLFTMRIDLHVLVFICLIWVGANIRYLGLHYAEIRKLMGQAIHRALPAIYIFILIGMVISSFMHSGTIATLMHYGLTWLTPGLFLPLGMILCALMSVATGTSWGTVGTLGVVFVGMGDTLDIPLPMVVGMVVSGATFGDKMSPISDTTNLAAMSAETGLYRHIYSMLFTTVPSFLIALILFTLIGTRYGNSELTGTQIEIIRAALSGEYRLAPLITLLPIVLLAILSIRRVAAEVAMSASILLAVIIAIFYQQSEASQVLNALWANTPGTTGIENLDNLLARGGVLSMAWTLILAIMALALGGLMHGAGFLRVLLSGIIARVQRVASLIATTLVSGLIGNMAMGEAYISIILNCQLFQLKYQEQGLDPAVLSRTVEEGSTLTTGLIPWTTAGAFYSATLGISALDYAPYAFFNYLNAIVAFTMASAGLGLLANYSTKLADRD
jgi:NhaC family Na+:H+ antiporter